MPERNRFALKFSNIHVSTAYFISDMVRSGVRLPKQEVDAAGNPVPDQSQSQQNTQSVGHSQSQKLVTDQVSKIK